MDFLDDDAPQNDGMAVAAVLPEEREPPAFFTPAVGADPDPVSAPFNEHLSAVDVSASATPVLSSSGSIAAMAPSFEPDPVGLVQLQKVWPWERVKSARIEPAREPSAGAVAAKEPAVAPVVQAASEGEFVPEAPPAEPSFLQAATARTHGRGPRGRAGLSIGVLLLAALLAFQVLRHERDGIAARQPGLRPLLTGLCAVTGCRLAALQRIGDITIDGAAFSREKGGDGYRLNFTLRNAANVPLAMPAVELSLLDTQEQVVVRRVLLPTEFGAPAVLAAHAERSASLPLTLSGAEVAALPPIAGYRVVAFYP